MKTLLPSCCLIFVLLVSISVGLEAGSRPITISDGSVCVADEELPLPATATDRHTRPFKLSRVYVEQATQEPDGMRMCMPLGNGKLRENISGAVIQFLDANETRQVSLLFNGSKVQITSVGLDFDQWQRHGAAVDRKKVVRGGPAKIQWIFLEGEVFDCRKSFCRITFQDNTPTQAP